MQEIILQPSFCVLSTNNNIICPWLGNLKITQISCVSCLHQPILYSRSLNTIGTKNAHSTSNNFRNSPIRPLCIHLLVFGLVRDPISQSKVGVHVIHHTKILEFFGCSSTFIRVYATIHAFVEGFRARSHLFSKFSQFFCCNATIFYVWEIIRWEATIEPKYYLLILIAVADWDKTRK